MNFFNLETHLHNRPNTYIRDEVKQAIFDNNAVAIGILLPKDEILEVSDEWSNNLLG